MSQQAYVKCITGATIDSQMEDYLFNLDGWATKEHMQAQEFQVICSRAVNTKSWKDQPKLKTSDLSDSITSVPFTAPEKGDPDTDGIVQVLVLGEIARLQREAWHRTASSFSRASVGLELPRENEHNHETKNLRCFPPSCPSRLPAIQRRRKHAFTF